VKVGQFSENYRAPQLLGWLTGIAVVTINTKSRYNKSRLLVKIENK